MKKSVKKLGRVSTESVLKCTGKNWDTWIKILTKERAVAWPHKKIVEFLRKTYRLGPWWEQGVACGFELYLGRREENRNEKGEYSLTATKSFPINMKSVWELLFSEKGQSIWLQSMYLLKPVVGSPFELEEGIFGEVRTLKSPQKIRMALRREDWAKPTYFEIFIVPKPKGKSILVFSHTKIANARLNEDFRARWKSALEALRESVGDK